VIELQARDVVVEVHPLLGGRVGQIRVGGTELLVGGDATTDPVAWGCFPMVPWAGRVRDGRFRFDGRDHVLDTRGEPHALHGTGFVAGWDVVDQGLAHAELTTALAWPLGGHAHQHLQLTDGALVSVLTVVAGHRAMPAVLGWHPWFRKPQADELEFRAMWRRGADGLPTGEVVAPAPRPWDDCFAQPLAPLRLHLDGVTVTIASDAGQWVVFDELHVATCVEPQTAPPDAFNLAAIGALAADDLRLEPTQLLQRTMAITWRT